MIESRSNSTLLYFSFTTLHLGEVTKNVESFWLIRLGCLRMWIVEHKDSSINFTFCSLPNFLATMTLTFGFIRLCFIVMCCRELQLAFPVTDL